MIRDLGPIVTGTRYLRPAGVVGALLIALTAVAAAPRAATGVRVAERSTGRTPARDTKLASRDSNRLARRIVSVSGRYLGTPYHLDPLGEGSAGGIDSDPLMDRSRVDCMTLVEQVLAEALAGSREEILPVLNRIRYRDGVVGFETRNHYLVTDWLPRNRWLVEDVTARVGGAAVRPMEKRIDRAAFFRSRGAPELGAGLAPERSRTQYIPRDALAGVTALIPEGAVLIWVQDRPGIIAAHCGFAVRRGRTVWLRHASQRRGRVIDEPLLDFARQAPARMVGLKVCQAASRLDTARGAR